jgi:hypothetical protein
MTGAFGKQWGEKKCFQGCCYGNLKEKDRLEDLGVGA